VVLGDECLGADTAGIGCHRGGIGVGGRLLGAVSLAEGHQPGEHGDDESDADGNQLDAEPPVGAGGAFELVGFALLLAVPFGVAGVKEGALDRVEVGRGPVAPLDGLVEADAAVQLAVGPAHGLPGVGGGGEVAPDALPFDVVVQPAPQPGPRSGEGFVGELDDVLVADHEPGGDELLDNLLVLGVGGDGTAGYPGPHGLALGAGCHEPQQQVPHDGALVGGCLFVELFGGLGHGATDAARGR
jgi:hypothetical protein